MIVNCTLKASPERSNTGALAGVVGEALGDQWPGIRERVLAAEILVFASPTWLGRPASVAQRVLERRDAMLSEQEGEGRPVAYNHVAGVVVTGNAAAGALAARPIPPPPEE